MKLLASSVNHRSAGRGGARAARQERGVSRQAADAWRLRRAAATHAHGRAVHRPISFEHTQAHGAV